MSIRNPRQFLISYDIANPKRLGRVHGYLSRRAIAVQYSVFTVRTIVPTLRSMLSELDKIINKHEDDVRAYVLSDRYRADHIGRQILPEGVGVFEGEPNLLNASPEVEQVRRAKLQPAQP